MNYNNQRVQIIKEIVKDFNFLKIFNTNTIFKIEFWNIDPTIKDIIRESRTLLFYDKEGSEWYMSESKSIIIQIEKGNKEPYLYLFLKKTEKKKTFWGKEKTETKLFYDFFSVSELKGKSKNQLNLFRLNKIENEFIQSCSKIDTIIDNSFSDQRQERLKDFEESKSNVLTELDKDSNGEVDVIEGNDFNLLLKKHQKSIVEIDRNYVQQFVKVSSYLKTKEKNIQSIFNSIKNTPHQKILNEYVKILKGDIHSYNLILFNSLNMIVSLVEDDMITFYEIHEQFDTLNMFDSKHEKDISQKLTNIGDGLENLIYEIRDMSDTINDSIGELSYVTEQSNQQLTDQLTEIDSTMKVGNLINTINTYQNYKINKNTKSLRG